MQQPRAKLQCEQRHCIPPPNPLHPHPNLLLVLLLPLLLLLLLPLPLLLLLSRSQRAARPLRVHFERGKLAAEDNVGLILFKKTVGVPRSFSAWQRRYFVLGGAVAKAHVLQVYVSKQVRYRIKLLRTLHGRLICRSAPFSIWVTGDPTRTYLRL